MTTTTTNQPNPTTKENKLGKAESGQREKESKQESDVSTGTDQ